MFRLEHKTGDLDASKLEKPRLGKLVGRNESVWKDDYEANCTLRRNFRVNNFFHYIVLLEFKPSQSFHCS